MELTNKGITTTEPFEKYIFCTDTSTITLIVDSIFFKLYQSDVINYTGEEIDTVSPHAERIYDSSEQQFTRKWFNILSDKPFYVRNGWSIEKYKAGIYSDLGKLIIDAFFSVNSTDKSNRLLGIWRPIGTINDPDNDADLEYLQKRLSETKNNDDNWLIISPSEVILYRGEKTSTVVNINVNDEYSFTELSWKKTNHKITWITDNIIGVKLTNGKYDVYVRLRTDKPLINKMSYTIPFEKKFDEPTIAYILEKQKEELRILKEQVEKNNQIIAQQPKDTVKYPITPYMAQKLIEAWTNKIHKIGMSEYRELKRDVFWSFLGKTWNPLSAFLGQRILISPKLFKPQKEYAHEEAEEKFQNMNYYIMTKEEEKKQKDSFIHLFRTILTQSDSLSTPEEMEKTWNDVKQHVYVTPQYENYLRIQFFRLIQNYDPNRLTDEIFSQIITLWDPSHLKGEDFNLINENEECFLGNILEQMIKINEGKKSKSR